jgi:hypothetical protein
MAEPQPNVLNLDSTIRPSSSTLICSFITSPHAGAPTSPYYNTEEKRNASKMKSVSRANKSNSNDDTKGNILPEHKYFYPSAWHESKINHDANKLIITSINEKLTVPTASSFLSRLPTFLGAS